MSQGAAHPDPEALLAAGAAAFRAGRHGDARRHFAAACAALGTQDARGMTALSDYGAACAALGDHAAARAAHEAALDGRRRMLGEAHPEVGASLHNLGAAWRALGQSAAAEACHAQALGIWEASLGPSHMLVGKAAAALAMLARARGDAARALAFAGRALDIRVKSLPAGDPMIGLALEELGRAQSAGGDDRGALDSWQAALAILRSRSGNGRGLAPLLNNCGVAARALGDFAAARGWFGQALAANPGLTAARHNLAAVLGVLGDHAGARAQRDLALREQCVFVQTAWRPRATVLIPSVADSGNVPLEHLLPARDFTRIWWFITHAGAAQEEALPPFDVIFNGIGDADMEGEAAGMLQAFARTRPGLRLLNHPEAVARTRRDRLAETLAGVPGIVVPPTARFQGPPGRAAVMRAAAAGGIEPPLLLRPAGAHGGAGVMRVDSWASRDGASPEEGASAWYVTRYHECRGSDGFYRKYRVAFVDRVPFAYHLAISRDWLVHYHSADMPPHDWKLEEEAAFLADPSKALGAAGWEALKSVGARLDLDFCGMDFALMPDGRLLVFEANATMLIHPETEEGRLAFKNPFVGRIIESFAAMAAGPPG